MCKNQRTLSYTDVSDILLPALGSLTLDECLPRGLRQNGGAGRFVAHRLGGLLTVAALGEPARRVGSNLIHDETNRGPSERIDKGRCLVI